MPRRYQNSMCRLGAAVVLRSACTPAAVTLPQKRTSRAVSAGRLLTAVPLDIPSPSSSLLLLYHSPDSTSPLGWLDEPSPSLSLCLPP